jgi:hypothetical protein
MCSLRTGPQLRGCAGLLPPLLSRQLRLIRPKGGDIQGNPLAGVPVALAPGGLRLAHRRLRPGLTNPTRRRGKSLSRRKYRDNTGVSSELPNCQRNECWPVPPRLVVGLSQGRAYRHSSAPSALPCRRFSSPDFPAPLNIVSVSSRHAAALVTCQRPSCGRFTHAARGAGNSVAGR